MIEQSPAYQTGYKAGKYNALTGVLVFCLYPEDCPEFKEWHQGYKDGQKFKA